MLRLADWNLLVEPVHRQAYRAAWTATAPLRAVDLAPYLEVLADPSVPRVGRWIAAHALLPALRDGSGALADTLALWVRSLPAGRRREVLWPLLSAAGHRAGDRGNAGPISDPAAAATAAATAVPRPAGAGAHAAAPGCTDLVAPDAEAGPAGPVDVRFWTAFGSAIVDDVPPRVQRALGWILRRIRTWPPACRFDARRLCAQLAERRIAAARDRDAHLQPPEDSFPDLVEPWAQNLGGADGEEVREFEERMLAGGDRVLAALLDVLPDVHAVAPRSAVRLFRRVVRSQARRRSLHFLTEDFQGIFRRLLEAAGPPALQAVLDAYAEDLRDAAAEAAPPPEPWAASLDTPAGLGRHIENVFAPVTDSPEGPSRRFPLSYHPDFASWQNDSTAAAPRRAGAGGFPIVLEDVLAGWLARGDAERARATLQCLLERNSIGPFWQAALHLLARFPRELASTVGVLLEDVGVLLYADLFRPSLNAVRACFVHLSDPRRNGVERAIERIPETGKLKSDYARRFQLWMAQAIAAAGLSDRPRRASLRAVLAAGPQEPTEPPPVPLPPPPPPVVRWSQPDDAVPYFEKLSSRFGAPMRTLWQFSRDHRGKPADGAAARAMVPLLADLERFWERFEGLWWNVLRTALTTALTAPPGSFSTDDLATLRGVLLARAARSGSDGDSATTRRCAAQALPLLLRHDPDARVALLTALGTLVRDEMQMVRLGAAEALPWFGYTPESAPVWLAATTVAANAGDAATLDFVFGGLLAVRALPGDGAFAVASEGLAHAEHWYRPLREEEQPTNMLGEPIRTDAWMGEGAARKAGMLLVVSCARGCEPACATLRRAFGATRAEARLEQHLVHGAAEALAKGSGLDPERRGALVRALLASPMAPEPRMARECVRQALPGDDEAALALAERMLARVAPPSDREEDQPAHGDLAYAAYELLTPLWARAAVADASAAFRGRMIACADRLLETPVCDFQVWERWLAAHAGALDRQR